MDEIIIEEYDQTDEAFEDVQTYDEDISVIKEEQGILQDSVTDGDDYFNNSMDSIPVENQSDVVEEVLQNDVVEEVLQNDNVADFVSGFGSDTVYDEPEFSGSVDEQNVIDRSESNAEGNLLKNASADQQVPVLDDESILSIKNIETSSKNIESTVSNIKDILDTQSTVLSQSRDDLRQIGQNQALSFRVQVGVNIAIFGAVLVYMVLSKIR